MKTSPEVPKDVVELHGRVVDARPMRRGSLSERWMKCGKAGCACGSDPEARHGPYFTLTLAEGRKTQSRYVAPDRVPLVRSQIEAGRAFRSWTQEYVQACERWGDQELEEAKVTSGEAAEKGGFKKRSSGKSRRKPRR